MEASFEAVCEPSREAAHLVFRPVGVLREADDASAGTPLFDELRERGEACGVVFGCDGRERMRDAQRRITYRNADALLAEIKCEYRCARGR
jgi:hypothetical protein